MLRSHPAPLREPTVPSCYFQVAPPGGWAGLWSWGQRSEGAAGGRWQKDERKAKTKAQRWDPGGHL